jgi:hypothetical protein
MDDNKEKTEDEKFNERLTWNKGDLNILSVPGKTPEQVAELKKKLGQNKD